jgi:hypothetical protein
VAGVYLPSALVFENAFEMSVDRAMIDDDAAIPLDQESGVPVPVVKADIEAVVAGLSQ